LKIKIFNSSALVCTALLAGSLVFTARPLAAETLLFTFQQKAPNQSQTLSNNSADTPDSPKTEGLLGEIVATPLVDQPYVVAPASYVATAYSLRGRTASGRPVTKGVIAADPRVLPLGTRVRLDAGAYSGEYLVADTGGMVRGKRIDIWTPTSREAMRFGRRTVKLTVLSFGGKRKSVSAHAQLNR
jgi:3D (Asp-Asp-Asp) domain-containing protein